MPHFLLYESPSGYALFECHQVEQISLATQSESVDNYSKFNQMIKLSSFIPFKSAAHALENANDISEGLLNETLSSFLSLNIKKKKHVLGVAEKSLAGLIKATLSIECESNDIVNELSRGVKLHAEKFLKEYLKVGDVERAQLGLGHSYSRAKIKFNVNRVDNMIIQAIALLDQLDKDINTFSMRIRFD